MPKKTKVSGTATASEVKAAYKGSVNPHNQKRLIALQMAQQGEWVLVEIGRAIGKGRSTVGRWLKAYRGEGIEGMLKRGHGGRKPQLNGEDIEALKAVLGEGRYKTAKEIRHWLATERGIEMSVWGVYYWLKKNGAYLSAKPFVNVVS